MFTRPRSRKMKENLSFSLTLSLKKRKSNLSSSGRCSQRRMVRILLSRGITLQAKIQDERNDARHDTNHAHRLDLDIYWIKSLHEQKRETGADLWSLPSTFLSSFKVFVLLFWLRLLSAGLCCDWVYCPASVCLCVRGLCLQTWRALGLFVLVIFASWACSCFLKLIRLWRHFGEISEYFSASENPQSDVKKSFNLLCSHFNINSVIIYVIFQSLPEETGLNFPPVPASYL